MSCLLFGSVSCPCFSSRLHLFILIGLPYPPNRHDINTEMAPVLYERFLWVKAGIDFVLNVILLAGCLVRGTALQTPAAAAALGALFQLEEVANLWLMFRMGQLPFEFLVLKDDASEVNVFFAKTLQGGLALGLLFTIPVLAGEIRNHAGAPSHLSILTGRSHIPNDSIRIHRSRPVRGQRALLLVPRLLGRGASLALFFFTVYIYTRIRPLTVPMHANEWSKIKIPNPPLLLPPTQFYAFYWFALCISLLCAANFVRVSRVSEHRRRKALQHVRYGDYYTRMTVEIAIALFFDTAIWLLPYSLRVASWASAAGGSTRGRRARWARLLDVYAIGYRGAVDALVYLPKDGVVAGACGRAGVCAVCVGGGWMNGWMYISDWLTEFISSPSSSLSSLWLTCMPSSLPSPAPALGADVGAAKAVYGDGGGGRGHRNSNRRGAGAPSGSRRRL